MAQELLPTHPTSHMVVVEAEPTPISIETRRTAVLVIDMQNDFGAQGGMFDRSAGIVSGRKGAVYSKLADDDSREGEDNQSCEQGSPRSALG
jgi:hypothetical protein